MPGGWLNDRDEPCAAYPSCGHHALQVGEVRAIENGAEVHLTCRAWATASTLGYLDAITGSMARSLAEHLAATRKSIEEFSVPLDG